MRRKITSDVSESCNTSVLTQITHNISIVVSMAPCMCTQINHMHTISSLLTIKHSKKTKSSRRSFYSTGAACAMHADSGANELIAPWLKHFSEFHVFVSVLTVSPLDSSPHS